MLHSLVCPVVCCVGLRHLASLLLSLSGNTVVFATSGLAFTSVVPSVIRQLVRTHTIVEFHFRSFVVVFVYYWCSSISFKRAVRFVGVPEVWPVHQHACHLRPCTVS